MPLHAANIANAEYYENVQWPHIRTLQTFSGQLLFRYQEITLDEPGIIAKLQATDTDRTIVLQTKSVELISQFLRAAWISGRCVAVIKEELPAPQVASILDQFGLFLHIHPDSAGLITISENGKSISYANWLSDVKEQPEITPHTWRDDECALILFTSGSTGKPKGVCHSLGNILRSTQLFVDHFSLTRRDTVACLAPAHTMSGLRSVVIPMFCGPTVHFFTAGNFLELVLQISTSGANHILCGPVFIRQLANYGSRLKSYLPQLQSILCTGADLTETDRNIVQHALGVDVLNYYGLTETAGIVLAEKTGEQQPGCLPQPCSGVTVTTQPVSEQKSIFSLTVHAPNLFLGYLGEPLSRRTALDTNDLVRKTSLGQLQLQGRNSGVVKSPSTEWLTPFLLEKWFRECFPLTDCHVSPVRLAGGYRLQIFADVQEPLCTDEIDSQIHIELGADYVPYCWEFGKIHRNPLGKIVGFEKISFAEHLDMLSQPHRYKE